MDKVRVLPGAKTHRAFVLLRPDVQRCGDPRIELCMFTLLGWVKGTHPNVGTPHEGDPGHNFVSIATKPPLQAAGAATVYIVADGPVTVRFRFTNLTGSSSITARSRVRGGAGALPDTCPSVCRLDPTLTTRMAFGGLSVPLRAKAFTYTLAYLEKDPRSLAGDGHSMPGVQAIACLKPNTFDPNASTDPADYLAGCSEPPKDENEVRQAPGNATDCAAANVSGNFCQIFEPSSLNRVYFGFRSGYADTYAALPDEPHPMMGGVYLWLEYGLH